MASMEVTAYPGYAYYLDLYQIIAHGTPEEQAVAREAQHRYISGPLGSQRYLRLVPRGALTCFLF